ncbi:MAG TPA: hypothetical protein VF411_15780 [Bacteroidia bacterium]
MKRIKIVFMMIAMIAFFAACGQSENEKKEIEVEKREDSIAKANIKKDIASEMDSLKKDKKTSDSLVKEEKK